MLLVGCQALSGRPADLVLAEGSATGRVLAMSPDSTLVAVGRSDGSVSVWAAADGRKLGTWRVHQRPVDGIAFIDNGRLISAGYDAQVVIWSITGVRLRGWDAGSPVTVFSLVSGDGPVLTGHADGQLRLWQLDGRLQRQWPAHQGPVRALAAAPQGEPFASSGFDGQVLLWNSATTPTVLSPPPTDARTLVFAPGGDELLGAGWFSLYRWRLATGALQRLETEHQGIINSLSYLPDGRLASISRQTDSSVLILDPATGATLGRLQGHALCGSAVVASADGRFLSSTSDDATVKIWRLDEPVAGGSP
jgi:WD40 repeat protein